MKLWRLTFALGVVTLAACGGGGTTATTTTTTATTSTTVANAFVPTPEHCWGTSTIPPKLLDRLGLYLKTLTPQDVLACETFATSHRE